MAMVSMNSLLNGKDSRWLQLEVCREFQRNKCSRSDTECKFAHPPANVEVQNGRVTACYDSIKVSTFFVQLIFRPETLKPSPHTFQFSTATFTRARPDWSAPSGTGLPTLDSRLLHRSGCILSIRSFPLCLPSSSLLPIQNSPSILYALNLEMLFIVHRIHSLNFSDCIAGTRRDKFNLFCLFYLFFIIPALMLNLYLLIKTQNSNQ